MDWGCISASGVGNPVKIDGIMKDSLCDTICLGA